VQSGFSRASVSTPQPPSTTPARSTYHSPTDDLIARVVAELAPGELHTMLRLAELYAEARWMTERERRAWRRAILARMDLPPVSERLQ